MSHTPGPILQLKKRQGPPVETIANLGQSLPLGRQLVLDLGLVGEEDLLHPLEDLLVCVEISDIQNILQ